MRLDSEDVLRSIEANHGLLVTRAKGIYSFSHLTFQEYFATRELTLNPTTETLRELVNHLTEKRWREVFLLAVEMLKDATELIQLMKQAVDQLLAEDERLQEYLQWLKAKTDSLEGEYTTEDIKQITKRSSFLAHIKSDQSKIRCIYSTFPFYISLDLNLDLFFSLDVLLYLFLYNPLLRDSDLPFYQDVTYLINKLPSPQILLKEELQGLFTELSDRQFKQWYEENGEAWTEKLRQIMITHRNIGHDWQFNEQQKDLLNEYRNANILLMECLGREAVIDRGVRAEIENTLFLPISN